MSLNKSYINKISNSIKTIKLILELNQNLAIYARVIIITLINLN